jgi:hypothetical protein
MTTENTDENELKKIKTEWKNNYVTYSLLFLPSKEKAKSLLADRLLHEPYSVLIKGN